MYVLSTIPTTYIDGLAEGGIFPLWDQVRYDTPLDGSWVPDMLHLNSYALLIFVSIILRPIACNIEDLRMGVETRLVSGLIGGQN